MYRRVANQIGLTAPLRVASGSEGYLIRHKACDGEDGHSQLEHSVRIARCLCPTHQSRSSR